MKLNKSQRFTAYCIMLAELDEPGMYWVEATKSMRSSTENGLCWLYKQLFDSTFDYFFENILPELSKFESNDWWSSSPTDWLVRAEALKQCIIETHP